MARKVAQITQHQPVTQWELPAPPEQPENDDDEEEESEGERTYKQLYEQPVSPFARIMELESDREEYKNHNENLLAKVDRLEAENAELERQVDWLCESIICAYENDTGASFSSKRRTKELEILRKHSAVESNEAEKAKEGEK